MCTATVNLPDRDLEINQVFIKDYSENAGVLDALISAGVLRLVEHIDIGPYNAPGAKCEWIFKSTN